MIIIQKLNEIIAKKLKMKVNDFLLNIDLANLKKN